MKKIFTLLSCLFSLTGYAQQQAQNWFFGYGRGLAFAGNVPTVLMTGQLDSYEACATVSDEGGNLQFYSNSVAVWDKNHTLMPGSSSLVGHTSTTQGALIVRDPGSTTRYYLFSVDACDNRLVGGMKYSVVDMSLRGGLGGVVQPLNIPIVTPSANGQVTEKLTAILHANGRDTWVMVHEWLGNGFFAFLVSPTGVASAPVISRIGSVHQGGGGEYANANAVGYMKASPNGRLLGVATRDASMELFDFNNATGQVSNSRELYNGGLFEKAYGVAFSPDNTKLYTTDLTGRGIYQYNLGSSTPALTRQRIGSSNYTTGALQLGPDGRIYVSLLQSNYVAAIANPNALGTASTYTDAFLNVGNTCQVGLPNFPNAFATQTLSAASQKLAEQVSVYPNPTRDVVWVRLPSILQNQAIKVTICDALGREIPEKAELLVSKTKEGVSINVVAISKGVYTLRIATEDYIISKQLVVQ